MVNRWLVGPVVLIVTLLLGACSTLAAAPDIQLRSDFRDHKLEYDTLRENMLADKNQDFKIYRKTTDTTDNTDPKQLYRPLMQKLNIDWARKEPGEKLSFAVSSVHDLAGELCQTKLINYQKGAFQTAPKLADSSTVQGHRTAIDDDWGITSETINSFDCDVCKRQN